MKKKVVVLNEHLNQDKVNLSGSGRRSHSTHFEHKNSYETICEEKAVRNNKGLFFPLLIIFIFWSVLLTSGILMMRELNYAKKHYTETVTGKVVEVVFHEAIDEDDSNDYYPIVEYIVDGQSFTVRGKVASHFSSKYRVGQEMTVLYNPEYPAESMIQSETGSRWTVGIIFICVGTALFILWIAIIITNYRKK